MSAVIHPTAASAYMLMSAVCKMQQHMALSGKVLCANKIGVLVCNLRLLVKVPRRFSRVGPIPSNSEFYDSVSARGLSGAIEAAMTLLPHAAEADIVLRVLGRFSSLGDCAVAPKGTRARIESILSGLINTK